MGYTHSNSIPRMELIQVSMVHVTTRHSASNTLLPPGPSPWVSKLSP